MSARAKSPARAESSDAELLARVATGDLAALAEVYHRHGESLRHFLVRATARANDVDDLVQTVFLEAARSAGRYDGDRHGRASCRPWLLGIAVHHLARRRSAFTRLVRMVTRFGRPEPAADPRASLEARPDIERALAALTEAKRLTFLLAELEELSGAEIAALMDVPIGTVFTRLHAARRELRAFLEAP